MRPLRTASVLTGIVVAAASVWLGARVAESPAWSSVDEIVHADLRGRPGAWAMLRSVVGPLGIPILAVVLAVLLYATWRRSRRDAAVLAVVAVGGSACVQLLTPALLPPLSATGTLSGHIGVASAVGLGWLVVARTRSAGRTAGLAVAVMTLTVAGMVLSGWHTLPEIIVSVGIPAGWAVAGLGFVEPRSHRWSLAQAHAADACLVLGGAGLAATALLAHVDPDATDGRGPVTLLLAAGTGVVLVAVGLVLGLRLVVAADERLRRQTHVVADGMPTGAEAGGSPVGPAVHGLPVGPAVHGSPTPFAAGRLRSDRPIDASRSGLPADDPRPGLPSDAPQVHLATHHRARARRPAQGTVAREVAVSRNDGSSDG